MNDGDKLKLLLKQVEDDAFYIDEDYPRMAERMTKLVKLIKSYDKNQKALIRLALKLQRENDILDKTVKKMYFLLNKGQKNILNVWLKGGDAT